MARISIEAFACETNCPEAEYGTVSEDFKIYIFDCRANYPGAEHGRHILARISIEISDCETNCPGAKHGTVSEDFMEIFDCETDFLRPPRADATGPAWLPTAGDVF